MRRLQPCAAPRLIVPQRKAETLSKRPEVKPIFSAIPARAMRDERLSALDLRVLMAVAAHDRFGANGIGCYASHTRLAELVGCHIKSLSRSLSTLATCGYLEGSLHPLNKKTRVYRVVYTEDDALLMKSITGRKGNSPATNSGQLGNSPATENPRIGNQSAQNAATIGNHSDEKPISDQEDGEGNIFCEAVNKSSKADQIHSGEPAPHRKWQLSDPEILARFNRIIKDNNPDTYVLQEMVPVIEEIREQAEASSQEYGWSERLLVEIHSRLNDTSQEPF